MHETGRPRDRRRVLWAGAIGLAALAGVAVAAPWIATDRPWLARDGGAWSAPAWTGAHLSPGARVVIPAPVPHDPDAIRLDLGLRPPSGTHWMGTDALGRDVAARVVHGARVSILIGLLSAAIALAVGVPLGTLAGYVRGFADALVSRLVETLLCFPTLLLLLAVLGAAPPWLRSLPDVVRISLVFGGVGWVPVARYLRGEVLRVAASDVVASARAIGAGPARIVLRHVLPASLAPVVVTAAFAVAGAIVAEASMSFLGLGIAPPTATWGGLLAAARNHVASAWWMVVFPGAALAATLLCCNLLGEGLRDALDPRGPDR